jgi:alpha-tubulin suppressor-like RCC1 family protein
LNDVGQVGLSGGVVDGRVFVGDEPGEMASIAGGVDLGAGRTVRRVTAGAKHTCAQLDDDSVKCWGQNTSGQLGLGDTAPRGVTPGQMGDALPRVQVGAFPVHSLVAGYESTCVLVDNGSGLYAKCWGDNGMGQLGLGDVRSRGVAAGDMTALPFIDLGDGRSARVLAAGSSHTCALRDDGSLVCWGFNQYGQLGAGHRLDVGEAPMQMGNALVPVNLSLGPLRDVRLGNWFSCALFESGRVTCWGDNVDGELGQGDVIDRGVAADQLGAALPAIDLGGLR